LVQSKLELTIAGARTPTPQHRVSPLPTDLHMNHQQQFHLHQQHLQQQHQQHQQQQQQQQQHHHLQGYGSPHDFDISSMPLHKRIRVSTDSNWSSS